MHPPTFIENQMQSFFPMTENRRRNTSKPACYFSLSVVSCDGVLGKETKVVLQNLAGSLAKKSGKSYSETTVQTS
jgi:hypothetical protein